jgi:GTPase SAR1 family protein
MFSLVGGIYDAYFSPPKLNLLLVGAPYVGKTTVLERCKVTQFNRSKKATVNLQESEKLPVHVLLGTAADTDASESANNDIDIVETPVLPKARPSLATTFRQNSRRWLVCPAPKKYAFNVADDEDEEEEMEPLTTTAGPINASSTESSTPPPSIPETEAMEHQNRQESMESVELQDSSEDTTAATNNIPQQQNHPAKPAPATASTTDSAPDFDLKPNAKMLPLRKIRPTIGMNLGKNLDICGAKCNVWDLGGRLEDLWERYYHDCDAVVFVWKVTTDDENGDQNGDNDDSDSDDERPELTAQMQLRLLEKVRSSIPDDIPFLVLGHYVTPSPIPHCRPDTLYSTAQLLPHYHNPCQALYFCNAGTGQGVRSAMEWLIPLAKRQQNIRDRSSSSTNNNTKDADVDGVDKGS